jgi:DNA-directed RNA polymerase subunit RPC12/RpoP
MAIPFACPCGRALKVADDYAGKRVRCPACGAAVLVPAQEPAGADFELVEDDPPGAVTPARPPARPGPPDAGGDPKRKTKGTRRKAKRRSAGGPLSRMYDAQAREQLRRDDARARAAGTWNRDEEGGWTLFGVHVTAGVLSGAGMLFTGLLATLVIALFRDQWMLHPRVYIASVGCTTLGGIVLIKGLFFGEED